jgi:methylase of polypeptide subunit release factors
LSQSTSTCANIVISDTNPQPHAVKVDTNQESTTVTFYPNQQPAPLKLTFMRIHCNPPYVLMI